MSKKESEFDRYERMRKLQKESEAEKRKNVANFSENKKRGGKPKPGVSASTKNWIKDYELAQDDYYCEEM